MIVTAGQRLTSPSCTAQVVVVRAPSSEIDLRFAGIPADGTDDGPVHPELHGELRLGKRLADETSGLEVLVTNAGTSLLTVDGRPLVERGAKALPASD